MVLQFSKGIQIQLAAGLLLLVACLNSTGKVQQFDQNTL